MFTTKIYFVWIFADVIVDHMPPMRGQGQGNGIKVVGNAINVMPVPDHYNVDGDEHVRFYSS